MSQPNGIPHVRITPVLAGDAQVAQCVQCWGKRSGSVSRSKCWPAAKPACNATLTACPAWSTCRRWRSHRRRQRRRRLSSRHHHPSRPSRPWTRCGAPSSHAWRRQVSPIGVVVMEQWCRVHGGQACRGDTNGHVACSMARHAPHPPPCSPLIPCSCSSIVTCLPPADLLSATCHYHHPELCKVEEGEVFCNATRKLIDEGKATVRVRCLLPCCSSTIAACCRLAAVACLLAAPPAPAACCMLLRRRLLLCCCLLPAAPPLARRCLLPGDV